MKYQVVKKIVLHERDTFNVGQIVEPAEMGSMLRDLLDQGALKPVTEKKAASDDKKAD